jgi:Tfp pilus assembly protein PilO
VKPLYPRERLQYTFAGVVALIALANLAFYLLVFVPTRNDVDAVTRDIARLEAESIVRAARLERLESVDGQLDEAQSERLGFLSSRVIPRREGFATLILEKERQAQFAGLTPQRVNYQFSEQPQFGLHAVNINIPLQGDYDSLTRFIRSLEESETFFILDSISLARADADQPGALSMLLNFTTYFYDQ